MKKVEEAAQKAYNVSKEEKDMKSKRTTQQRLDGELAVRKMSEKAQRAYGNTTPLTVWEYHEQIHDDSDEINYETKYAYEFCGDYQEDLTMDDIESFLESFINEDAEAVASEIRALDEWDDDLNRELCELAGLEKEYDAADGETFESVVYKAAEMLGVEI